MSSDSTERTEGPDIVLDTCSRWLKAIERQDTTGLRLEDLAVFETLIAKPMLDGRKGVFLTVGFDEAAAAKAAGLILGLYRGKQPRAVLLDRLAKLRDLGFDHALRRLIAALAPNGQNAAGQVLPEAPPPTPAPAEPPAASEPTAPLLHRRTRQIVRQGLPRLRPRIPLHQRPSRPPAGPVAILSDPVALERAIAEHESALDVLEAHLARHAVRARESDLIDLHAVLNAGPAIFEAKSLAPDGANEREQVLAGFAQLHLYEHQHRRDPAFGEGAASLWLLLSAPPRGEWSAFLGDKGVGLLWIEDGSLAGPGLEALSAALPPEIQVRRRSRPASTA